MQRLVSFTAASFLLVQVVAAANEATFAPEQIEFFERHVRPLLVARCYECHSSDAPELQAELYVDSREGLFDGGEAAFTMSTDLNEYEAIHMHTRTL